MEKEFVPYELAVKLKELGFKEECLTRWGETSKKLYISVFKPLSNSSVEVEVGDFTAAPLWQQAFDWLGETKDLRSFIDTSPEDENIMRYFYTIKFDKGYGRQPYFSGWFYSLEEAKIACLSKLLTETLT